jgi:hypothetical protein
MATGLRSVDQPTFGVSNVETGQRDIRFALRIVIDCLEKGMLTRYFAACPSPFGFPLSDVKGHTIRIKTMQLERRKMQASI